MTDAGLLPGDSDSASGEDSSESDSASGEDSGESGSASGEDTDSGELPVTQFQEE